MSEQELIAAARAMHEYAYVPYSHFPVGAALETEDGRVYTGCNVENAAYGSSLCAERTALVKAISEGARRFRRLAIVGAGKDLCWPCGACRQMLCEFSPNLEIFAVSGDGQVARASLQELLPHSFGPHSLHV